MTELRKGYDNAFFVDAILAGKSQKKLDAIIDTGASNTHINNETCIENDLKFLGSRTGTICIHGSAHKGLAVPVYEASVTVGSVKSDKLIVIGLNEDVTHGSKKVEAIIGRDILKKFVAKLDWKNCKGKLNIKSDSIPEIIRVILSDHFREK